VTAASSRVLILANQRDFAADAVVRHLHDAEVPVVRWNAETLAQEAADWQPGDAHARFASIWLRQFLPEPAPAASVNDLDETLVVRTQWSSWLASLDEPGVRWVNPLWAARRAENKIVQLRAATALGLPVPPTTVTSNRDTATRFRDAQPDRAAVVKSLSAGYFGYSDQAFMFTENLTDDLLDHPDAWTAQPLIVQCRLARLQDIRVIVVNEDVFAAALHVDPSTQSDTDWRLTPGRPWHPLEVPEEDATRYRALTRELGLTYAAIDLIDDGTTHWFLEANQAGEFAFIDNPLRLGVAEAIARALAGQS
jgi:glutathione synthase/RimK-type ligase-like ATP-grasp enzyme